MKKVILYTNFKDRKLERVKSSFPADVILHVMAAGDSVNEFNLAETAILCFSTGVILPQSIVNATKGHCYNIHPGSPDFPGRDPHHHAIYRSAKVFGATIHHLSARVDEGPIVATELFTVSDNISPCELLEQANEAGFRLLTRFGYRIARGEVLESGTINRWNNKKTTRKDFLDLCCVTPSITEEELRVRIRALRVPGRKNLHLILHGRKFVLSD